MEDERFALDARTCVDLLDAGSLGRVAFTVAGRPHVQVVAYHRVEDRLEVGAAAGSALTRLGAGELVAVQVDGIDRDRAEGWTVVASGPASAGEPLGDGSRMLSVALAHAESTLVGRWVGRRDGAAAQLSPGRSPASAAGLRT